MAERAPSEPDVFLSYARENETRARELATALGQRGFSVFWDREVPPGQTWHSYIGEALGGAKCVVVAWSSHSVASQWVLEEAGEGKDRNVLVPVLFETVQPPFGFRAIQAASLIDWNSRRSSPAFDSLVAAVERIVGGQRGSGAEGEASTPPMPVKPGPKAGPPITQARATRPEPGMRSDRQATMWSGRMLAATVAAVVVLAGGTLVWRLTQPGPAPPAPEAEAEATAPEAGPSDPAAETEASGGTTTSLPAPDATVGDAMRECAECPEMVLVPAGEFLMGSPPGEPDRDDDEGPQRQVKIAAPFWVGKYEVTFAEWDACVAAGGCGNKPEDAGWGRDNRPVISVSWNDAKQYVRWLSRKTGKTYRLLSEAEWEYAARAGTTTAFWWGEDVGKGNANCAGCGSARKFTKTAPVGSFKANDFGLYDTAGNVWEWVEDCWQDSYHGAPADGSAWVKGDCSTRVLRGGSWGNEPRYVRSAYRSGVSPVNRVNYTGFRVARTPD